MIKLNTQSGVGLVEVLVSLLLLAVAVLGFTTLQMRSVQATDESLKRTQAMSVIRGLSEDMRNNILAADTFAKIIEKPADAKGLSKVLSVTPAVSVTKDITVNSCQGFETPACTDVHVAARDALQAVAEAQKFGMELGVAVCPGTEIPTTVTATSSDIEKYCIIAAWDGTEPVFSKTDANACANENGIYKVKARCIVVGAY